MAGFPNRIARSSLGPKLRDKWPVVDPETDIGEATLNLLFFQTSGMNTVSPRILLSVEADAGGAETVYQGIAWDPDNALPKITWTRVGTGVFSMSLPQAQYPDANGVLSTVEFLGGRVDVQALDGGDMVVGQFIKTGPRAGEVHLSKLNGTKVDVDFILTIW